jgi:magnesium transporter
MVAASMIFSLLIAGVLGTLIPALLKRFRFDPALASSVFVVTLTDVITLLFYLGLAAFLAKR